jgi:hypothetical protein
LLLVFLLIHMYTIDALGLTLASKLIFLGCLPHYHDGVALDGGRHGRRSERL